MFKQFQYVLLVLLSLVLSSSCSRETKTENQVAARFYAVEAEPNYQADLSKRQVFPFSVVPGGTITKEEVKAKVAADPTVREHYKGIDFDKLKPFRLTRPAMGYVSYRIGNKIFWTSQRLYLKPGEILLSDGISMLRGRCGNRVSLIPMGPVRKGEPSQAVLDLPSWDSPVFQAMVREANSLDGGLPFSLPGDMPQTIASIQRDLPDSYFPVAPPPGLTGPGAIGGGLPGGLPSGGPSDTILLTNQPPLVYVAVTPTAPIVPPFILIPSITPVEITYNFTPPGIFNGLPIGVGSPVLFIDVPIARGIDFPVYTPPGFPIFPLTPPVILPPDTPIVHRPIELTPPLGPPNGPPHGPLSTPPDPLPPETVPPPVAPIPEPATLFLVPAAAALLIYYRRAATAKAGS